MVVLVSAVAAEWVETCGSILDVESVSGGVGDGDRGGRHGIGS